MKSVFDSLNLRPQERRLVVAVGVTVFVVLNLWLVWPHFDDWKDLRTSLTEAETTLAEYHAEVARLPQYREQLDQIEGAGGAVIPSGEQAVQLVRTVQTLAARSGIARISVNPAQTGSAGAASRVEGRLEFFEEQILNVTYNDVTDKQLLDLLLLLGGESSVIRVRDLNIVPEQNQTKLGGRMTLVASFPKTPKRR